MKKLNYLVLGLAGLAMASCSQEEVSSPGVNGAGNVQFKVTLPKDMTTRADIGSGLEATQLYALAYETTTAEDATTSNTYLFTAEASFPDTGNQLQTTVNMELLPGKSYNIVFFAAAQSVSQVLEPTDTDSESTAVYSINASTGALTVNYNKMEAPGEDTQDLYDCFYTVYPISNLTLTGVSTNVELTRPVAQVNWGTTMPSETANTNFDDVLGKNGEYIATDFTATGVPSQMNLLTGATTSTAGVSWTKWAMPPQGTSYPDISGATGSYTYLAMQYLLAPASSSANIDMTLTVTNANAPATIAAYSNTIKVSSAPVQANYQTNIYGSLLTSGADFNVEIKPGFGGTTPIEVNGKWDGTVTIPVIPEEPDGTPIPLTTPAELAGLAALVNGTNGQTASDLEGYTFELSTDMDMAGEEFPMIGSASRDGSSVGDGTKSFKGTFNGGGHTISNLTIDGTSSTGEDVIAFIPSLAGENAKVENINFENLNITSPKTKQTGGVVGLVTDGATVSKVSVKSGKISGYQAVGGVVARVLANGNVIDCSNGAEVTGSSYNIGGVIGAAYYTTVGTNMVVTGCSNSGNVSGTVGVAGVVGLSCAEVSDCSNTGTITGTGASVGGVIGEQKSAGSVKGCTNSGNVNGGGQTASSYGAGGIVGWVRYENGSSYQRQNIIVVSGNTNEGSVQGQTGTGGIVGVWYQCGECYGNTNTGSSLVGGNSFVGGIIGDSQWTGTVPDQLGEAPYQNNLFVQNNYSNTPESAMKGSLAVPFVYVNDSRTIVAGNSMIDKGVVNTKFEPAETTDANQNSWTFWESQLSN